MLKPLRLKWLNYEGNSFFLTSRSPIRDIMQAVFVYVWYYNIIFILPITSGMLKSVQEDAAMSKAVMKYDKTLRAKSKKLKKERESRSWPEPMLQRGVQKNDG